MPPTPTAAHLIAAPHTPFRADGRLNPDRVEEQARHLAGHGVDGVFVAGTTGESLSLAVTERRTLAGLWLKAGKDAGLRTVIHVGANSLQDACTLATHAGHGGADAIAAMAPSYFKPAAMDDLVEFCTRIAACAPNTPFFLYDIPSWTGVHLPTDQFLREGLERIPTLAGVKFTSSDLTGLQRCLQVAPDRLEILFGNDEALLAGLALGARGAVGSTYNFAAPVARRLIQAFDAGDLSRAREEQRRIVQLVDTLAPYGYMAACKCLMGWLGVDCGPVRPPLRDLDDAQRSKLRQDLDVLGFFEWIDTEPAA